MNPSLVFSAAVAFSSVAIANVPAWLPGWSGNAVQTQELASVPVVLASPEEEAPVRSRARCDICGVVQAIHRIEAGSDAPASFEFTVRLRDGTIRTSRTASAAKWRSGDQIMLIGGASASAANLH